MESEKLKFSQLRVEASTIVAVQQVSPGVFKGHIKAKSARSINTTVDIKVAADVDRSILSECLVGVTVFMRPSAK